MFPPARIVCLTEETVETLYLPGEGRPTVGGAGFICAGATETSTMIRTPTPAKAARRIFFFLA